MLGILLLVGGCAGAKPGPTSKIEDWKEPTSTAARSDEPSDVASDTRGPLSPAERRELSRGIEIVGAGFAADGKYIIVRFRVAPQLAMMWQPGRLYVIDEATKAKYANIPFMPKIGFLIGRPATKGQIGYVMLDNNPPLRAGSEVTVVLDVFRKEHVRLE